MTIRLGLYAIAAAVCIAALGGLYAKGHADGANSVRASVERAVAAERDRQQRAAAQALDAARQRAESREAEISDLKQKVDAYEADIAARPAAAQCVGSPADLERMQQLLR